MTNTEDTRSSILYNRIIEAGHFNLNDLKALSQVCRGFADATRPLRWRSIKLSPEPNDISKTYYLFLNVLERNLHVLPCIRSIRFSGLEKYVCYNGLICRVINRLWLVAKNIDTLELSFGGLDWNSISESTIIAFESLLLTPRLKSLSIRNVKNLPPTVIALCIKHTSFVELTSVSFCPSADYKIPFHPALFDELRDVLGCTLTIADISQESAEILRHALDVHKPHNLDTIIAGPLERDYSDEDIVALYKIMKHGKARVTTLDFRSVTTHRKFLGSHTFNFKDHPNLNAIKLRMEDYDTWSDLLETLQTLNHTNNLSQIGIQIKFNRFTEIMEESVKFDEMLADDAGKLRNVHTVLLMLDWGERDQEVEVDDREWVNEVRW